MNLVLPVLCIAIIQTITGHEVFEFLGARIMYSYHSNHT